MSHGAVYYVPREMSAWDLALMRAIDALHLDFPFASSASPSVLPHQRASRSIWKLSRSPCRFTRRSRAIARAS